MTRYNYKKNAPQTPYVHSEELESELIVWERQMIESGWFEPQQIEKFKTIRSRKAYIDYCESIGMLPPKGFRERQAELEIEAAEH